MSGEVGSTGAEPEVAPPSLRRRRPLLIMVPLVVALLLAGSIYLFFGARHANDRSQARLDAMKSAKARVPLLLSYQYKTLSHNRTVALEQTTGAFHKDYEAILSKVVVPTATRKKISTTARVSGAAVVSGDSRRVVVLVFLTQSTTGANASPQVTGSRVDVTMTHTAGGWKISSLDPV
jgi:Mce-associated membrane protein